MILTGDAREILLTLIGGRTAAQRPGCMVVGYAPPERVTGRVHGFPAVPARCGTTHYDRSDSALCEHLPSFQDHRQKPALHLPFCQRCSVSDHATPLELVISTTPPPFVR